MQCRKFMCVAEYTRMWATISRSQKRYHGFKPPKSHDSGGLAFSRFFAIMRFADKECRKKGIISKNGSLQDVEQLSPAAKAQYPF